MESMQTRISIEALLLSMMAINGEWLELWLSPEREAKAAWEDVKRPQLQPSCGEARARYEDVCVASCRFYCSG
jgi:hypothetical protein